MRFVRILCLVVAVVVASSGVARADTLQSLLGGGTLSAGDKIFGDFSFTCASGDCAGQGITPTAINVTATFDSATNTGFLTFSGDMISLSTTTIDFLLKYTVTATAGVIIAIDQSFQPAGGGTGGNTIITEDVRSGSFQGTILALSTVSLVNGNGDVQDPAAEPIQGDQLVLSTPQTKAWVTKDVNLTANAGGGTAGTSNLIQSFHQTVPEPTSLLLLGTGLTGLALWRRRSS